MSTRSSLKTVGYYADVPMTGGRQKSSVAAGGRIPKHIRRLMKKYNCTAVEAEKIAEEKEKEAEAARENDRTEGPRRQKDEEEDEEDASDDDREGGPEGHLTRGQRRKMKKMKAKYADQDEVGGGGFMLHGAYFYE